MQSNEARKGGRPKTKNRQGLYSIASRHARKAIDTIAELLNSKNEAIRLGAARSLLDKCLPDVKATTMINETPEPIRILFVNERELKNE